MQMSLIQVAFILFLVTIQVDCDFSEVSKAFCETLESNIKCDPSQKYRSIDGRCNNLKKPFIGAANTRLKRLIRSQYGDKISKPPKSVTGSELPNARSISLAVFNNQTKYDEEFTQAFLQFSEFIVHDISNVKTSNSKNCCQENGKVSAVPDANCMYIPIPSNDEVHKGKQCLNFVRSLNDHNIKCPNRQIISPAQQINFATSFLDLSTIYGTSVETLKKLRSFKNGELKLTQRYGTSWPPQLSAKENVCPAQRPQEPCYFSGDSRINQNPQLSIVQILFIREHNRIARELNKLNPKWTDEILFQEARRINIAKFQHIFFYEWFTGIGKENHIKDIGIYFQKSGGSYANFYNSSLDPSTSNEFSAALFRILHSMVEGSLSKLSESQQLEGTVKLSDTFFRPKFIEGDTNFESFLRGMLTKPARAHGKGYDDEIRSYLFKNKNNFGSDLKAIDIQRGRDHGLGSYNDLRIFCGLKRALKWEDFGDVMDQSNIGLLRKIYTNINDVELNVAVNLERPILPDVFLTPSCFCTSVVQFNTIRMADRFWYETGDPLVRFTPKQLTELRKASFSRLVCDNTKNIQKVPKKSFELNIGGKNPLVKCSEIPVVNLSVFKE